MTDIGAIRARYVHYGETDSLHKPTAVHDIRVLLEEIDRLRSKPECECYHAHNGGSHCNCPY